MVSAFEVPLVLEIKKHPCLYNYNLPEYNRKDTSEEAWGKVSRNLNLTVNECKDKWKNIRSSYVRSLKTVYGKMRKPYYLADYLLFVLPFLKIGVDVENTQEESQPRTPQPRTPQSHVIASNEEDDEDDQPIIKVEQIIDSDNDQIEDPLTNSHHVSCATEVEVPIVENGNRVINRRRKRKLVSLKNYIQRRDNKRLIPNNSARTDNNAMRYFLLSLLPELESMDEDQIRQFKIKVMLLIDEIKTNTERVKKMSSFTESEKLQKKLINLLLKNIQQD